MRRDLPVSCAVAEQGVTILDVDVAKNWSSIWWDLYFFATQLWSAYYDRSLKIALCFIFSGFICTCCCTNSWTWINGHWQNSKRWPSCILGQNYAVSASVPISGDLRYRLVWLTPYPAFLIISWYHSNRSYFSMFGALRDIPSYLENVIDLCLLDWFDALGHFLLQKGLPKV